MRSNGRVTSTLLVVGVTAVLVVAAQQPQIHLADGDRPAVLDRLTTPDDLGAIAISSDGLRAMLSRASAEKPGTSIVELISADAGTTASIAIPGIIRALLFDRDGSQAFGLLHKPAKKREGETHLVRLEWEPARFKRLMRVPPSARGLDHWPARDALLVASRNELRTIGLPELRSGRLFRITGENLSIATLAGGSLVLVGQRDGLMLVDLEDPPGEEEMPVRDRVQAPGPVVSLAAASDGSRALARLGDGLLYSVSLVPLRIIERGTASAVAALRKSDAPPALSLPPAAPRPRLAAAASAAEISTSTPAPAPTEAPSVLEPEKPVDLPVEAAAARPAPLVAEIRRDTPPKSAVPAAKAEPSQTPRSSAQVQGRIVGPAAGRVREVVLLGPNNILKQAARVRPTPDGRWEVDGLAPGRYRVQVDGGGDRVLISEPPFLLIDVADDGPAAVPDLRVLRAL